MQVHELKTWPTAFEALRDGDKRADFRPNDRQFHIGDVLLLEEYVPEGVEDEWAGDGVLGYTGQILLMQITHIELGGKFDIPDGFVVLSVVPIRLEVVPHEEAR